MNFLAWLDAQDPDTCPFRPQAATTEKFGLRTFAIGSPAHLGVDRGGMPFSIVAPFDCRWIWQRRDGTDVGSLLRIIPKDGAPVELQVFHSDIEHFNSGSGEALRGDYLPPVAAALGIGTGPHTHTELVVQYDETVWRALTNLSAPPLYTPTEGFDWLAVEKHANTYKMPVDGLKTALERQISAWAIREIWDMFAVRERMPDYRRPEWGSGPTMHVDTLWALHI